MDWQRELINEFVKEKNENNDINSSYYDTLNGLLIFRINKLVEMEELLVITAKKYLPFLEKILNESDENEINNEKNGEINNRNTKITNLKLLARFKSVKKGKKVINSSNENEECSSLEVDEVRTYSTLQ